MHLPGALVLSLGLAASAVSAKRQQRPPPANAAVLLSSVQSLTLRGGGAKTSHRRVPAVPQLRCVSPRALCSLHAIDVMRCTNQGSSYGDQDVEWSCAASLPAELKLGATDVICEGYASADDPYVLKGSCGVEYTLALTELGERRYPDLARGGDDRWFGGDAQGGNNAWAGLFFLVFVAVLAWIVSSSQQQQGWRPGFWTGLASGAAASYLASGRNRDNRNNYGYAPWGSNNYGSGSRWGGGDSWAGPSSSSSSSSRRGGSSSGERHESTGFGSTRRR
ncbi:Store-operated calcium entry-associated regulatory factor [Beauveria bassiana]|nr:Store-operated calcium entry-associated regulatory factor [Beauveria bassiana]